MVDDTVGKIKGFLLNPVETFQQSQSDDLTTVFVYFGLLLIINTIFSTIFHAIYLDMLLGGMFVGPMAYGVIIFLFFALLIGGFIMALLVAVWLHMWVYLLGGRNGIRQTTRAYFYARTPTLLFGWLPLIGILCIIWELLLSVIGIRELQEISTAKAASAVAMSIITGLLLAFIAFLAVESGMIFPPAAPPPPGNWVPVK